MKINKKYLLLRILSYPFRLVFTLFWMILFGFMLSIRWLLYGSQELYFGKNFGGAHLAEIVEQNEKIIESFKL